MVTKNDYKTLIVMSKEGCTTEYRSITILKLADLTKLSHNKVRDSIKVFIKLGYIKQGALQVRAKTYYLTDEGTKKVKELLEGGEV